MGSENFFKNCVGTQLPEFRIVNKKCSLTPIPLNSPPLRRVEGCADRHDALIGREVGAYGICVNAIAPGLVEHEGQNAPPALTALQLKERSIKRLQTPEDLMGTLVFLCTSDSDFMTGQAIVVDGGSVFH